MSNVYIEAYGHGSCYVDNYSPQNGDVITIYAHPDSGYELLDLYCYSEYGYSIAIGRLEEQQLTYDGSWGDITIYATFSRDIIEITDDGNGAAGVSDNNPSDGQTVILTAIPQRHYKVSAIICYDLDGNVLWTASDKIISFIYQSSWGNINIEVYFEEIWIYKNLWILFNRQWWRKNNY